MLPKPAGNIQLSEPDINVIARKGNNKNTTYPTKASYMQVRNCRDCNLKYPPNYCLAYGESCSQCGKANYYRICC